MDNPTQSSIPPFQPQPQTQTPVSPAPNLGKTLLFILMGLIFTVGLVFTGIQIGKKQTINQQPITEKSTISPTQIAINPTTISATTLPTEPNPTINPMADWKTYINTKFNYEIKYPEQYAINETGMGGGDINKAFGISIYKDIKTNIESPRFAVNIRQDKLDFFTIASQHFNKISVNKLTESESNIAEKNFGYALVNSEIVQPLTKTTLFGLEAYTYMIKGNFVDNGLEEYSVPIEIHKYVWLQRNDLYIIISFTDVAPLNQILSTFKLK